MLQPLWWRNCEPGPRTSGNSAGTTGWKPSSCALSQFYGTDADMESLASMVANKPSRSWVDADIERATVELAEMAQRFMRVESLAHVKGRSDRRHSMAVTVGMSGRPATVHDEFDVTSLERPDVGALVAKFEGALQASGEERRNVILAALAELSALYLDRTDAEETANRIHSRAGG